MAPFAIAVAFPTDVTGPVKFALVVTVAALPVTLPVMGLVKVLTPPTVWLVLRSTKSAAEAAAPFIPGGPAGPVDPAAPAAPAGPGGPGGEFTA